jgi:hypothetical protein
MLRRNLRRGASIVRSLRSSKSGAVIPRKIGGVSSALYFFMSENVSPFVEKVLGLEIHKVSFGELSMQMRLKPYMKESSPNIQNNGILAAVMDHVGGLGAWTVLDRPGFILSTVDLHVEYFSPLSNMHYGKQKLQML